MKRLITLIAIIAFIVPAKSQNKQLESSMRKLVAASWEPMTHSVKELKFKDDGTYYCYISTYGGRLDSCYGTWKLIGNNLNIYMSGELSVTAVVTDVSTREMQLKFDDGKIMCYKKLE